MARVGVRVPISVAAESGLYCMIQYGIIRNRDDAIYCRK